jgi:hypothetical protein
MWDVPVEGRYPLRGTGIHPQIMNTLNEMFVNKAYAALRVDQKQPRVPCMIGGRTWQDRWGR